MITILMVEDDAEITLLLKQYLPKYGIDIFTVLLPSVALEKLEIERYDLVLLDLGLPEMDGLELCKIIRKKYPNLPIIISTARGDTSDKVVGFELGIDDYIAKPYDPRELVARIQNAVRKSQDISPVSNEFEINSSGMIIKKDSVDLELTVAEYEIFSILLNKPNIVISKEYIVNSIDSVKYDSGDRSIDVMISRIRAKLKDDAQKPKYIKTIRGAGYKFIG